jgi:hypothetical protein
VIDLVGIWNGEMSPFPVSQLAIFTQLFVEDVVVFGLHVKLVRKWLSGLCQSLAHVGVE